MSIQKLKEFLETMELSEQQMLIGRQILKEIRARVSFLSDVGLDYLSLGRATGTLSGGEAQRIRLATQIGSGLVGVAYILDEPSIGLHQRDNDKLLHSLMHLRDLGNTLKMCIRDSFNYEVSRSLAACDGAILVVDAAQGIEAQTLANVYMALDHDLDVIPVINKIDLPSADPERVINEICLLYTSLLWSPRSFRKSSICATGAMSCAREGLQGSFRNRNFLRKR